VSGAAEDRNPHGICTWDRGADCAHCGNSGRLMCRMNYADLLQFMLLVLGTFVPAIVGMIRGGYGVYLVGYGLFWGLFFGFVETRVLCSHCPFYAERSSVLRCPANYGLPKLWRYRPGPMSRLEKATLLVGFAVLFGYPMPFLALGRQVVLLFITCNAVGLWFVVMLRNVCRRCVNFSCPFNRVPRPLVDEYLRLNRVMREAWEASGYRVD
jgi:hypothetical protein